MQVILLGHHPTGSNGYLLDYGRFITDVHARFSDVIMLHLLGHGHSDTFALVSTRNLLTCLDLLTRPVKC
jgi:hypothetical protein